MARDPIILLGMHRSGTTLLSFIMETFGVFLGHAKEKNNESILFMMLNQWLLRQTNASWDNPYCFKFASQALQQKLIHVLEYVMSSDDRKHYLGPGLFQSCHDIRSLNLNWGWKDPRNTFTVDVWKHLFPNARLINIYRNPIDVAESLRVREQNWEKSTDMYLNVNGYSEILSKNIQFQQSARLCRIEEGIALWREYIDKAFLLDKEFGDRILHLRYEDLLDDPEGVLDKIVVFTGLKPNSSDRLKAASLVNNTRKYAFTKDEELTNIYLEIKADRQIKMLGYDNIPLE